MKMFVTVEVVDADAVFDGHRGSATRAHMSGNAFRHQSRFQLTRQAPMRLCCTRSEGHPTLRLTASYPASSVTTAQRARGVRVRAAQLRHHRMPDRVETQEARAVTVQRAVVIISVCRHAD